jgi:hypothetical protein
MANESFLIIMLSLCPHPKGRMEARGGGGANRKRNPIMVTYPSYIKRFGAGVDSPTMKAGRSADIQK